MSTVNALKWVSLTAAINAIKSPNRFLQKLLFSNHQTLPTEDIELSTITGGRDIAPFVRKNGEAILVSGTGKTFLNVAGPNIRIKQAFEPSTLLYARQPGTNILVGNGETIPAINAAIARDLQYLSDMITNATEYLCAQALTGAISYVVEDQEVITITIPRAAGNTIVLTTFWNDATPANTRPLKNIQTVKEVMSEAEGLAPTDAICGSEAAAALLELHEVGAIKLLTFDPTAAGAGNLTFSSQFSEDGVIYLGTLGAVRFWQYSRTANLNGVATPMIRPKYVEFVNIGGASERVLYFAAIPDIKALRQGKIQAERFSKSWEEEDPSRLIGLGHSRPLPWPRKPNATVSVKVVSG